MLKNILISFLIILLTLYIDLSLYYKIETSLLCVFNIFIFSLSSVSLIMSLSLKKNRLLACGIFLVLLCVYGFWYTNLQASNNKDWQKDVAVLSSAKIENNLITVYNIRNIKYKTETHYDVSYYDEVFDLNKLDGIYFIATYWMGPSVAHTFLSFSFSDGKYLAISVEARKEKHQTYSMLAGFFKDNELYYVVASEQDLIGLRTNIRKNPPEHVYMYKVNAPLKAQREVFLNYMSKLNELKEKPEFYNTLTSNCTTVMWKNSILDSSNISFNWKILVSGYAAQYLYENNLLKTYGLSFDELKIKSYINPLVDKEAIDNTYSSKIRSLQ